MEICLLLHSPFITLKLMLHKALELLVDAVARNVLRSVYTTKVVGHSFVH